MSAVEQHRSPVYRQLEAYGETWKRDHDAAMACRDWEDAIAIGVNIFHMLQEREQAWRDEVFRGAIPYSEDDNLDHQTRFAGWSETTREVLAEILPILEKRFGMVAGADELRRCAQLAEAIVSRWQPPRLAAAVGQREMTLSPQAAGELDRLIEEAKTTPPSMPKRQWDVRDASFLKPPA